MNIIEIGQKMKDWRERIKEANKKEREKIYEEIDKIIESGWAISPLIMAGEEDFSPEESPHLLNGAHVSLLPSLAALIVCCDCGLTHKVELLLDGKTDEHKLCFYRDDEATKNARSYIGKHACPICYHRGGDDEHYEGKESGDNQE